MLLSEKDKHPKLENKEKWSLVRLTPDHANESLKEFKLKNLKVMGWILQHFVDEFAICKTSYAKTKSTLTKFFMALKLELPVRKFLKFFL